MTKTKTLEDVNPTLEFYYQQKFTELSKRHGLNSHCQLGTDDFLAYFRQMEVLMDQFCDIAQFAMDNSGQATDEELRAFFSETREEIENGGSDE